MKIQVAIVPKELTEAERQAPDTGLDRLELAAQGVQERGIQDDQQYEYGGQVLRLCATAVKRVKDYWAPLVSTTKASYDWVRLKRDERVDRLEKVRKIYEGAMARYRSAEEEQRAKLQEQMTAANESMRTRLEKDARKAILSGDIPKANALKAQGEMLMTAQLPDLDLKLDGVAEHTEYDVEVTDLQAFLEDVVAGKLPLYGKVCGRNVALVEVRESLVKDLYKSMGGAFNVRGIKITPKISYRPRAERD